MRDIQNLYNDVSEIIVSSQQNAVRSVNCCRVQMCWRIGKRILETEQNGRERAEYGAYLLKNLAKKLEPEYGSGFSYRQLYFCRQFYRMYPIMNACVHNSTGLSIGCFWQSRMTTKESIMNLRQSIMLGLQERWNARLIVSYMNVCC